MDAQSMVKEFSSDFKIHQARIYRLNQIVCHQNLTGETNAIGEHKKSNQLKIQRSFTSSSNRRLSNGVLGNSQAIEMAGLFHQRVLR